MPGYAVKPVPSPTGGTGGALTDVTGVSYTSPTNSYGSKYHLYAAGLDWTKPVGLVVHFHGDAAFEYLNPTNAWMLGGTNGIIAQAKARNMILLVPLTPDDGVGRFTWWAWYGKEENPRYAKDLIAYILGRYDIDKKRIWFSGYSGGAQFVTRYLLPHFGADLGIVGGGFIVFGGGQAPATTFQPYNPAFKTAWHCRWVVGATDDGVATGDGFNAVTAATAGATWYAGQGFTAEVTQVPGMGHDLSGLYGPYVGSELDEHPPAGGVLAKIKQKSYWTGTAWKGIKSSHIWDGSVWKMIYSSFSPSGMTKNGSFASANGSAWVDLPGWAAESGSTVTSNALISSGGKTNATISAQVAYTIPSGSNTVGVRILVNGVVIYTNPDKGTGYIYGATTILIPMSTTYTIPAGAAVKVQIKTQYSGDTIATGTNTYLRIA